MCFYAGCVQHMEVINSRMQEPFLSLKADLVW